MTKAIELRTLADVELAEKVEETRRELFNLRFQLASSQATNTARISVLRRELARLLTIQTERELAISESEAGI